MVITDRDLEKKFVALSSLENKLIRYRRAVGILLIPMMGSILANPFIAQFLGIYINFALIIPVILIVVVFILAVYSNRFHMAKDDRLFFEFYKTNEVLDGYVRVEADESKRNARTRIEELVTYVENWSNTSAPTPMLKLSKSISENLREKIIPLIENDKRTEVSQYQTKLGTFLFSIYGRALTMNDLTNIEKDLTNIPPPDLPIIKKEKRNLSKNRIVIYAILAVITYVSIWVYVQSTQPQETITTFATNSGIAFGIIGVLSVFLTILWKRKPESTTTTEVGEDNSI